MRVVKLPINQVSDEDIESGIFVRDWTDGVLRKIVRRDIPLGYYHWVQVEGKGNPLILKPEVEVWKVVRGDELR